MGPNGPRVEKPSHPITIRELMSHTAGFTYGPFSESQVDTMYVEKKVLAFDGTLRDMITRLAGIPLRQQPGTMWHYSVAVDVQGYLVEVLSGQRFDQFLESRIFKPLGMADTGFYVPKEKANRFAQIYAYAKDGRLIPPAKFDADSRIGSAAIDPKEVVDRYLEPPTFLSGGGGMVSTTIDYMRFCQMLLNGGELNGVRILSPLTVELMHRNQLPRGVSQAPGMGFGLDFAVVDDPVASDGISVGELLLGWRRRHVVLDRPCRGSGLRGHDPAVRNSPPGCEVTVQKADVPGDPGARFEKSHRNEIDQLIGKAVRHRPRWALPGQRRRASAG